MMDIIPGCESLGYVGKRTIYAKEKAATLLF